MTVKNIEPLFSSEEVDKAANNARNRLTQNMHVDAEDEKIIENRRASHAHVLNTWQAVLRGRVKKSKYNIVFAQRQKRLNTIYDKFRRWPNIPFSTMQDIAGCRLIFENIEELEHFRKELKVTRSMKHILLKISDYIHRPKQSGYRGIHEIYEYHTQQRPNRSTKWDGLKIEIQYRTITQHIWATGVEIADCLTNGRIKYSAGNEDYLTFFKLVSEMFARVYEHMTSCLPRKSNIELVNEFKQIESKIHLLSRLKAAKLANINDSLKSGNNIILDQFITKKQAVQINIEAFKSLAYAQKRYFELEQNNPTHDIVLVRANDIDNRTSIKNAYRNYFINTKDFVHMVEQALSHLETDTPA